MSIRVGSRASGSTSRIVLWALLLVTLLLAACDQHQDQSGGDGAAVNPAESALEHARKHQDPSYVCPMHPNIVRDQPASCPICGMDLVAKMLEEVEAERPVVTLGAAVMQNMGLRTARIERGTLWKYIKTQGKVAYDDDRVIQVHPRTAGWIENLYVRTDGVRVKRKDDLADYFSPEVLWAQQDYIDTLEAGELESFGSADRNKDSYQAFRQRAGVDLLRYYKVPGMDVMGIEKSMEPRSIVPIKAPQGGVITEHRVREGMYVTPADAMFTIVDLSEVWVMVDIFEHQIAWLRPGLTAEISTPAYPGRVWEGKVDFVYPEVHPQARTLRARLEFTNQDELLMPNMFVEAVIYGGPKRDVLIVPREALILTGEREMVVKVLGDNTFQPVEIETGMWQGSSVEVRSGLDEGDEVVLSGQFMIDSESNLQASFRRLAE